MPPANKQGFFSRKKVIDMPAREPLEGLQEGVENDDMPAAVVPGGGYV